MLNYPASVGQEHTTDGSINSVELPIYDRTVIVGNSWINILQEAQRASLVLVKEVV